MNNKNKNIIENSLKLVKSCPICNQKYDVDSAQIASEIESGYLMYFSCKKCLSSLLAQVIQAPFGLIGSAILTDLELNEVLKFKKGEKVNVDDVLEVYQKLEK